MLERYARSRALAGAAHEWLVMLLGARGFPLGEHRRIGGVDPRLYGEQLHIPWLVRLPDGAGRLGRGGELTTPLDLMPTLLDWLGDVASDIRLDGTSILPLVTHSRSAWRDSVVSVSQGGQRAIRTAEWCLRRDAPNNEPGELYVRPDDRWEANDVAKLCPSVEEQLTGTMEEHLKCLSQGG
jgi:arylsulfatase A-like enzyme